MISKEMLALTEETTEAIKKTFEAVRVSNTLHAAIVQAREDFTAQQAVVAERQQAVNTMIKKIEARNREELMELTLEERMHTPLRYTIDRVRGELTSVLRGEI